MARYWSVKSSYKRNCYRWNVEGYVAGPHYNRSGSGSNFQCLPEEPQWKTYVSGHQTTTGGIYGSEYELYNNHNNIFSEINGGGPLANKPAPCAVCYVQGRSTVLMIPARTVCPDGWTAEYARYLVSEFSLYSRARSRHRSSYVCLDEAPEVAAGGINLDHSVIYPVEVHCGTLPCSVYDSGRELACIVCSKWWFLWRLRQYCSLISHWLIYFALLCCSTPSNMTSLAQLPTLVYNIVMTV